MEQTQPSRLSGSLSDPADAQAFANWLTAVMREREYALPPHGRGGVRKLAADAGVAPSVVSTLLRAENAAPSMESLRRLAVALHVRVSEILIRANIIERDELHDLQHIAATASDRPPLTIDEAADGLGITDPDLREMHASIVQTARDLQRQRLNDEATG